MRNNARKEIGNAQIPNSEDRATISRNAQRPPHLRQGLPIELESATRDEPTLTADGVFYGIWRQEHEQQRDPKAWDTRRQPLVRAFPGNTELDKAAAMVTAVGAVPFGIYPFRRGNKLHVTGWCEIIRGQCRIPAEEAVDRYLQSRDDNDVALRHLVVQLLRQASDYKAPHSADVNAPDLFRHWLRQLRPWPTTQELRDFAVCLVEEIGKYRARRLPLPATGRRGRPPRCLHRNAMFRTAHKVIGLLLRLATYHNDATSTDATICNVIANANGVDYCVVKNVVREGAAGPFAWPTPASDPQIKRIHEQAARRNEEGRAMVIVALCCGAVSTEEAAAELRQTKRNAVRLRGRYLRPVIVAQVCLGLMPALQAARVLDLSERYVRRLSRRCRDLLNAAILLGDAFVAGTPTIERPCAIGRDATYLVALTAEVLGIAPDDLAVAADRRTRRPSPREKQWCKDTLLAARVLLVDVLYGGERERAGFTDQQAAAIAAISTAASA